MTAIGLLLGAPLLAALLAVASVPYRRAVGWVNGGLALLPVLVALTLGAQVAGGSVVVAGWQVPPPHIAAAVATPAVQLGDPHCVVGQEQALVVTPSHV